MAKLSELTDPKAVEKAIHEYDSLGQPVFLRKYGFKPSRMYVLEYEGRPYDSKAIVGAAFAYQHGKPIEAGKFSGGEKTVERRLTQLGFTVRRLAIPSPATRFVPGRTYDRRKHIHAIYGGQEQGGISTPADAPAVFLFTGASGHQYGYDDGWTPEGVYLYTGEGQLGDMAFAGGNRAVRDHLQDGKDLLLFESLGKGKGYRYMGVFACLSWETEKRPDKNGVARDAIVFHLSLVRDLPAQPQSVDAPPQRSLKDLRQAAYAAAKPTAAKRNSAATTYRERSDAVKEYVLARAKGYCEACKEPAPFLRGNGLPYLEPHHIRRLADDGPDDPRWMAGICPTCHRRIHYGKDGDQRNQELQAAVARIEMQAGQPS